jgi:hypothetical protein
MGNNRRVARLQLATWFSDEVFAQKWADFANIDAEEIEVLYARSHLNVFVTSRLYNCIVLCDVCDVM